MRLLSASLLLSAGSIFDHVLASPDCGNIIADSVRWNLKSLKGRQEVSWVNTEDTGDPTNTTYRFDLCGSLGNHRDEGEKGCDTGSWVCAFQHKYDPDTEKTDKDISAAWSIAGTFQTAGGAHGGVLAEQYERLKASNANADQGEEEGVRLIYHGGKRESLPARFIATMVCDKDKHKALQRRQLTSPASQLLSRAPKKEDDSEDQEDGVPEFVSYQVESVPNSKKNEQNWVLRIRWKTIHACEDEAGKSSGSGSHWGFFTWFIIILFLLVAAYLIFGSWLNYNRHGARGWDLLPHGDTIRDIPYLLKDWGRAVVDTVQGTHTRGGYNQI